MTKKDLGQFVRQVLDKSKTPAVEETLRQIQELHLQFSANDQSQESSATAAGEDEEVEELITVPGASKWNLVAELVNYLYARAGLAKLHRKKPNTAYFGNWGIIQGIELLIQERAALTSSSVSPLSFSLCFCLSLFVR